MMSSRMFYFFYYVVEPTKRASAHAFRIFANKAFGDCLSPYISGFITDQFKASSKYMMNQENITMNREKLALNGILIIE